MIKISKLADYGVVVMAALATNLPSNPAAKSAMAASELSAHTHLPLPTVAKLLKQLTKAGMVSSVRGAQGGYALKRAAENISLADIVQAVDGPVMLTACSESKGVCNISDSCALHGSWVSINHVVKDALAGVTLHSITQQNKNNLRGVV